MKAHFIPAAMLSILLPLTAADSVRADPPKIVEFRIQEVNQKIYFHVRVRRPADMLVDSAPDRFGRQIGLWDLALTDPTLQPRLVPQDGGARLVYFRERMNERLGRPIDPRKEDGLPPPRKEEAKEIEKRKEPVEKKPVDFDEKGNIVKDGDDNFLDFYGVLTGKKEVAFLFMYPRDTDAKEEKKDVPLLKLLQQRNVWVEEIVKLDPAKATKVALPREGFRRDEKKQPDVPRPDLQTIDRNDLEGNWALAQALHFSQLEAQTPEFGFYSFARETTSKLYKVNVPNLGWRAGMGDKFAGDGPGRETKRVYEVTTGAAAITESLALDRMRNRGRNDKEEPRTVPIASVRGIDIDEHPWKKMMGDKKPAAEPLAELVPHDNYYIHFKTIAKFLETGDLLDQWGTSLARAYEVNSRDHRIKQKLEQQICLKSTGLARVFGPAVIKSLAITGNDPYLREGSDFTMIFQVTNKLLFQTGTEPTLQEARKKFGKDLREDKSEYQGIAIESFVTPLREVSLHRAMLGDYAVYSNSGAAVRRIIDAHKLKIKRLADALDFQYMRTVFRLDDPAEDGFVFLSDAFIRNLVGPAVRIKERRRLEALTSLQMLTNGAMFTAWESGKPAQNYQHILDATGMTPPELFSPDGNAVTWNQERKSASSNVYNTLHFATPLIELPIDNVTPSEARDYEQFRLQYLGLWRQFFDPIGMRLSLKPDKVSMETYILPLVRTTQYNELRRIAGDGTIKIDSAVFSDKTLLQFFMHVSPQVFDRDLIGPNMDLLVDLALRSWLGDWFTVRVDDSPVYAKMLESYIRAQMFPDRRHDNLEDLELILQTPLTLGFEVRSPVMFAGLLTGVRKAVENTLPGAVEWGPMKEPYKGVSIVEIKANAERLGLVRGAKERRRIDPRFYYALIDGAFYISLREAPIRDLIDRSIALKDRKDGKTKATTFEVNSSLHLGPKAAVQSKDLLKLYLEWETHRRAQLNNRLLYALFKSNVVGPQDDSKAVEAAALQYLGFVPVSPDLAPFRYEWQKDEVINLRHGSLRQPTLNPGVDKGSPLGRLLEEFAAIRADLRFREDGIHTTLTLKKQLAK